MVLLDLKGVWKYGKEGDAILKGITGEVEEGDFIAIIGPSGAGKSTLLSLLNRMEDAEKGEIYYKGKELKEWNILELRREIGMVLQKPTMLEGTVAENIRLGRLLRGENLPDGEVASLLKEVGLDPSFAGRDVHSLSGGELQRVSLARTLAVGPNLLLLDEVTSALDPQSVQAVEQTLMALNRGKKKSIAMITHNIDQAARLSSRVWFIAAGELVETGRNPDIFLHPGDARTKGFLTGGASEHPGWREGAVIR